MKGGQCQLPLRPNLGRIGVNSMLNQPKFDPSSTFIVCWVAIMVDSHQCQHAVYLGRITLFLVVSLISFSCQQLFKHLLVTKCCCSKNGAIEKTKTKADTRDEDVTKPRQCCCPFLVKYQSSYDLYHLLIIAAYSTLF